MIARLILSAVAVWLAAEVMDGVTIDHWVYVLNTHYTHGIDMQTDYKKAVSAVTTKDISNFVRDVILKGGSHVEVIMLPEE